MRQASEDELDAWMARLAQGERSAFAPLFRALYPRALRLALRKLSEYDATDVAQSTLMRVLTHASQFDVGKPLLPWFYAIVATEVRAVHRRAVARRLLIMRQPLRVEEPMRDDNPEQLLLDAELRKSIQIAIGRLDHSSAVAIRIMLDGRERPPVPEATFRKRVSRAYARMKRLLLATGARE